MKANMGIHKDNKIYKLLFFLITTISLVLKTFLFSSIVRGGTGVYLGKLDINVNLLIAHLSMIIIIVIMFLFFKNKGQVIYLILIDCLYTLFLIGELVYFRNTRTFISIRGIIFPHILNASGNFKFTFNIVDLLFLIDIPIIIIAICKIKKFNNIKRNIIIPIITIAVCIFAVYETHLKIDVEDITKGSSKFMQEEWSASEEIINMSPLGYQYYELMNTIDRFSNKITDSERDKVNEWLNWNNEDLPDNKYAGLLKGKNLLFLQVESLEDFVINKKVNGQEITPTINKLIKEGIYFSNIYEQNNAGSSVDCDFMVNTSVLPLGDSITFLTHSDVSYNSLPKIMKNNGYNTSIAHAVSYANFHWGENAKSLGFDNIWSDKDFKFTKWVGGYRSDEEYLLQYAEKLNEIDGPFYSMIATISSHGPFDMQDEYKELKLSSELNENRLGEYIQSIHYTDKQIAAFLEKLDEYGILDDTVVVLYGDHGGVHKYYQDLIKDAPLEGNWWQEDNMKIPFIIYSKDLDNKKVETYGGQSDIMPTVLSLMGIDYNNVMGRNLLNTKRNATVYVDRNKKINIVGKVANEEEREKLEEAYNIADIIIKNRFYERELN